MAEAGFDFWIIGVVIAVLLLLAIVFVVVCVLFHRKMQKGVYPGKKTERLLKQIFLIQFGDSDSGEHGRESGS